MMWRPGTVGMADPPRTPQTPPVSAEDLRSAGFSDGDIERLRLLQDAWPHAEFCDDNRQFDYLRLMRWMARRGEYREDT